MRVGKQETERQPWEQQDGETDREYQLFCCWLSIPMRGDPPKRHPTDVQKQLGIKHISQVSNTKTKWSWDERTAAWEEFMASPKAIEMQARERVYVEALQKMGDELINKGMEALQKLNVEGATVAEVTSILKLGMAASKEAGKLISPMSEREREELINAINTGLTGLLADEIGATSSPDSGFEEQVTGVLVGAEGSDRPQEDAAPTVEGSIGVRSDELPEESAPLRDSGATAKMVERSGGDRPSHHVFKPSSD